MIRNERRHQRFLMILVCRDGDHGKSRMVKTPKKPPFLYLNQRTPGLDISLGLRRELRW